MAQTPAGLDHVNIFVRNAARSYEWYQNVFGFHTQDTMNHPGTDTLRAVFLSCDEGHAHDIALFGLGIVGASAFHAVARTGARVVGLEATTPAGGTTATSFAWLNACRKEPEGYHRLNADGMAAHRELAKELGPDGGHHE